MVIGTPSKCGLTSETSLRMVIVRFEVRHHRAVALAQQHFSLVLHSNPTLLTVALRDSLLPTLNQTRCHAISRG